MAGKLAGKVAIVTGAGLGIGEAIAKKFVAEGAKVVCVDVNDENGQKKTDALPKGSAVYCHGDVTIGKDWESVLEKALSTFGKLDICVNNAGIVYNSQVRINGARSRCKMPNRMLAVYRGLRRDIRPVDEHQRQAIFRQRESHCPLFPEARWRCLCQPLEYQCSEAAPKSRLVRN
jgi:NAD(P)-dependent dehydrogenase (short-subunit alcohol dehydrogenase family)